MNVIFIMNDSFRRDHLGCYGNSWITTPNLDEFAGRSAVFEQCYIASYPTVPNRWDLSTGRYGFPHRGWQPLGDGDVTWAQIMSARGVHTQFIWDTPMLAKDNYNYTRGFDGLEFVHGQKGDPWITDPGISVRIPSQAHKIYSIKSLGSYCRNHANRRYEREYCVGRTISTASDWLETNCRHESFFLWIDMWDPHEPFDCPWYDYELYKDSDDDGSRMIYPVYGRPTYMSDRELRNARALYAGNCTLVDRWIGNLLRTVEKLGLMRNTLIVWTTDHGHLFGDHDLQGKPGAELGTLFETTTRIPLIVYHPDGLGSGSRINGIVQPPDILPSLLEFLDIRCPGNVEGRSFWPLVTGASDSIHDYAFSSRFPPSAGEVGYHPIEGAVFDGWVGSNRIVEPATVTGKEWAYICAPQGMRSHLYDLKEDPNQETDVLEQNPEVAGRLRGEWIGFLEKRGASGPRIEPFIDKSYEKQTPSSGSLYAFRDDMGQWIAFTTRTQAEERSHDSRAIDCIRDIEELTFDELLGDNPKNLVYLYGQYYWAQDLV